MKRWVSAMRFLSIVVFSHSATVASLTGLNGSDQFDFLIGNWTCTGKYLTASGSYGTYTATWKGYYLLERTIVADDFRVDTPNGAIAFLGSTFRTYNPDSDSWSMQFYDAVKGEWGEAFSGKRTEDMVMIDASGKDAYGSFLAKIAFYDIKEDSFKWKEDRSYDNGKTWIKNTSVIEATRVE
ncbi:MAG: hypothetical protein KDD94_09580 [Calditrichaeota bacterium]|nr:hypothetical protein [Calditrichota bacterium]